MKKFLAVAVATFSLASLAQAAVAPLQGRDINGKAVDAYDASAVFEYDPNLNLTWLRNSPFVGDWQQSVDWASTLTVGRLSGWTLPTFNSADKTCLLGYNCIGTPLGYLFQVELGNPGGIPAGTFKNDRVGSFDWLGGFVWTDAAYDLTSGNGYFFQTEFGRYGCCGGRYYGATAEAVRPGDVLTSAVPEPQTYALMLAGLAAVGAAARRRKSA